MPTLSAPPAETPTVSATNRTDPAIAWDADSFVVNYRPLVRRAVRHVVGHCADADDIEQDVLFSLIRTLSRATTWPDNIDGYIWRAARNTAIAHVRRDSRRRETDERVTTLRVLPVPPLEDTSLDTHIAGALLGMSPDTRWAMWATSVEGWMIEDAARHLHIGANVLSARLYRARKELRRTLPDPAEAAAVG